MHKTAGKGHTRKHAHGRKVKHSHQTRKHHPVHHHKTATAHGHHVHTVAHHAHHAKARGLALAGMIACCTVEALAASLRLQGLPATDTDVLRLHRLAGADDNTGMPLLASLESAREFSLAGYRPVFEEAMPSEPRIGLRATGAGLILGLELPGPHTVLATPDGWWSWGELYCPCEFPDAVIEEAWAVSWA